MAFSRQIIACLIGLVIALGATRPATAIEQSTPARAAFLLDLTSGAVLLAKNPDLPVPPASMSKLMTLDVVFEALESGRLALDDEVRVSGVAAGLGGSSMFLRQGELVKIADLLNGVIVQSGNDASVAFAEELAGTEAAFADHLNTRARELGLTNSTFVNATGWPHPDHKMSVRDLAMIATRIIQHFPQYYPLFSQQRFEFDGRVPANHRNRNPLLGLGLGVDGLKTGHTEEAGYGLVTSAKRGERRIVLVIVGLESEAQRKQEAERLVNWAFRAFDTRTLYRAGEPLLEAEVWIGEASRVPLAPAEDVVVTIPFGALEEPMPVARFREPAEAPVAAGDVLGEITVTVEGMDPVAVPLIATQAVARGGFFARIEAAAALVLGSLLPTG
ncbi:MAG: D-alanyl-D-alanine carboxypeptidase family protein [Pikeienuella sp.]